ncbi:MAG: ISAs1 family transposase [Myxococcales bacterium]|nr:ISAs1 family transposase [Myxococcales bacterium]
MAQSVRSKRRILGMLVKRVGEARLDEVVDPHDPRGRRWALETLLTGALLGLVAGSRSLKDVEWITDELTPAVRAKLGISRRVPDTTLRDTLSALSPSDLRPALHNAVRAARRRKSLEPDDLPFGVVSLDGKGTAVPAADDFYAQRQTAGEDGPLLGVVRTLTATLTSSCARPVIDVLSIPAITNEMGVFRRALDELMAAYAKSDMFRLITYDAGACSKENAQAARDHGLHYLLAIKSTQPTLHEAAVRWLGALGAESATATSSDIAHGNTVVRRLYVGDAVAAPEGWDHLRTVLRVEVETLGANGARIAHENRYFISSPTRRRLTDAQWLLVVRQHWGVETSHPIIDTAFAEDDHPWIEQNPRATVVVMLLRRIAYTLLTLWRGVTLRSDEQRTMPWRDVMRDILLAAVTATAEQLCALRRHRLAHAPA